jgi:hypothetical protein
MRRLIDPTEAAYIAIDNRNTGRIQNGVCWIEGDVPFIFSIMAVSALIFGGIHCIAWNFEFPSRAELILWITASLTSAIVPVILLASCLSLNYVATTFSDNVLISSLIRKLRPLDQVHADFWESLISPWDVNKIAFLASIPTGSRNFEEEPRKELQKELEKNKNWEKYINIAWQFRTFGDMFKKFINFWEQAKGAKRDALLLQQWGWRLDIMEDYSSEEMLEFWDDFEDYCRSKTRTSSTTVPKVRCARHVLNIKKQFEKDQERIQKRRQSCGQASRFLTICCGIVYTASRLIILVLLFTCLRAVPEGVYKSTPWTRFLPKFS